MQIEKTNSNGVEIIKVSGRVDSGNSAQLQDAVASCSAEAKGLIFDFCNLEYISSAGLRVLLAAKKKLGNKTMKVTNVSSAVFDIFDVTGFSSIIEVEKSLREVSVDGCELIGAGACGECFRLDDETIIKLYFEKVSDEEITREKHLAKQAFVLGIPTAISYDVVSCGGRKGVVYEMIKAKTLSKVLAEDFGNVAEYAEKYAALCKLLNETDAAGCGLPSFKEFNRNAVVKILGIDDDERALIYKFIDSVPESDTCIHGDLNPNNVMVQDGEYCLIDMGDFSTGNAMFDVSRIMFAVIITAPEDEETGSFLHLKGKEQKELWRLFLKNYFGADTLEEAAKLHPEAKWVEPLAVFRFATFALKAESTDKALRDKAMKALREKLLPFAKTL